MIRFLDGVVPTGAEAAGDERVAVGGDAGSGE